MIAKNKRRKKRDNEASLFTSILLVFLIIGFFVFLIISNVRINKERKELQARIENLKQEIREMEKKKQELEAKINSGTDLEELEKKAREELDLKKANEEVVVVLPPEKTEKEKKEQEKGFWQKLLEALHLK